jgi:hypothetical protein
LPCLVQLGNRFAGFRYFDFFIDPECLAYAVGGAISQSSCVRVWVSVAVAVVDRVEDIVDIRVVVENPVQCVRLSRVRVYRGVSASHLGFAASSKQFQPLERICMLFETGQDYFEMLIWIHYREVAFNAFNGS